MSDWWAIRSASAVAYVDQEMPGTPNPKQAAFYSDAVLRNADAARADSYPGSLQVGAADSRLEEMVIRLLGGMLRSNALDHPACSVGCSCGPLLYGADATSEAHTKLSRDIATASIVLLKNEDVGQTPALPLQPPIHPGSVPYTIALVGSACSRLHRINADRASWTEGDIYVTGGSGRVIAPQAEVPTIEQALQERSAGVGGGFQLLVSRSDNADEAVAIAEGADAVIACGGVTATESIDRADLRLHEHNFLADLAARLGKPVRTLGDSAGAGDGGGMGVGFGSGDTAGVGDSTGAGDAVGVGERRRPLIVLAMAAGPVLTRPWGDAFDAVALMFLGGAQMARAWADVLLGAFSPVGRLPLTLPLDEQASVAPCPHSELTGLLREPCEHSEGLYIGWRAYIGKPVAYPFGHGLSFTVFDYAFAHGTPAATVSVERSDDEEAYDDDDDDAPLLELAVLVSNAGQVAGGEIAQLYLSYPEDADEPPLVLRGFQPTRVLQPAEAQSLSFCLTRRDLSVWVASTEISQGGWRVATGRFELSVGASSRDIRLKWRFDVTY